MKRNIGYKKQVFLEKRLLMLKYGAVMNIFIGVLILIPLIIATLIAILSVVGETAWLYDVLPNNAADWVHDAFNYDIAAAIRDENVPNWIIDIFSHKTDELVIIGGLSLLSYVILFQFILNIWLFRHRCKVQAGIHKLAFWKALFIVSFSLMPLIGLFVVLESWCSIFAFDHQAKCSYMPVKNWNHKLANRF